jgi:hypothetical protein
MRMRAIIAAAQIGRVMFGKVMVSRVMVMGSIIMGSMIMVGAARAETVFVQASFGSIGNGWLFGSRRDESCWLALPYHLIQNSGTVDIASINFIDQAGRSGETGPPIAIGDVAGGTEAVGNSDLAFARVTVGRKPTECPSRLGLPSAASFLEALRSDAPLEITFHQRQSVVNFQIEPFRLSSGETRSSLMKLRALKDADSSYFQQGISGAVAELRWQGRLLPAAMVLQVETGQTEAPALRFDKIRAGFELVEGTAKDGLTMPRAPGSGLDFAITSLSAHVADGSAALGQLAATGTCWRAAPPPGQRSIEIVISVPSGAARVTSLRLVADPACGPGQTAVLETANAAGAWSLLSSACPIGPGGAGGCRVNRPIPRELRLRISPKGGWVGLSQIVID